MYSSIRGYNFITSYIFLYYDKLMSNKCSNCDYLLSVINNTKIKLNELKKTNQMVKENNQKILENNKKMLELIDDLSNLVEDLREKIDKLDI